MTYQEIVDECKKPESKGSKFCLQTFAYSFDVAKPLVVINRLVKDGYIKQVEALPNKGRPVKQYEVL